MPQGEGTQEMGLLGETWRTARSLAAGLAVTFREMVFEEPITVQYPEVTPEVPPWFRGIPVLKTNLFTGEYRCTACLECSNACPIDVITIEWHTDPVSKKKVLDRFALDMSRCMLCNYCIEACPFDSFVMGYDYELCKTDPERLVYELEDLLRLGLKYSEPKYEPHGRGVKPGQKPTWVFAGLTGATEADIQDPAGYLGRPPIPPKVFKEQYEPRIKAMQEARGATAEAAPGSEGEE